MKRFAAIYFILLSLLTVAGVVLIRAFWPEQYPPLLFIIPLFFALMFGVMLILKKSNDRKGRDRSHFFLAYRVCKILLALVLLVVYFAAVGEQLIMFAVVFMAFYISLSMAETVHFMKLEHKR